MENVVVHKSFEIGVAPYRFEGVWSVPSRALQEANPSVYNLAWGDKPDCCHCYCEHCGTPIDHHYIVCDANGYRFSIGSSCVEKLHDYKLTTAVKEAERKRQRDLQRAKAEEKRQARIAASIAARQASDEAERQRNGGMTDFELSEQKRIADEAAAMEMAEKQFSYFLDALRGTGGSFCESIAGDIVRYNRLPERKAFDIMIEITAKFHGGRRGSKAYYAAMDTAYEIVDNLSK